MTIGPEEKAFRKKSGLPLMSESEAIDAIVASQKAGGDPIDPNGARRFVKALIAVGLFKPA